MWMHEGSSALRGLGASPETAKRCSRSVANEKPSLAKIRRPANRSRLPLSYNIGEVDFNVSQEGQEYIVKRTEIMKCEVQ